MTLVVYDISNDRTRAKIADICLDYGLERIQYSAFAGDLTRTHAEELMLKARKKLGKQPGTIWLVPVCEKDWQNRLVTEQKEKP